MFESIVIKFLKKYLGDYIDNLENISLGIISGELDLSDLEIKPNKLNEMKLPFKLIHGRIGNLKLSIPWKSNFSNPTILNIEEIHLVVSLIPQEKWEFIDFISGEVKVEKLKKFAENKFLELTSALTTEEKNLSYYERTLAKIIDNIHVNIKNVHFRIEEPNKAPFYSLGFTLQEMMVINTDENWKEIFIDRNKYKDMNIYKLLKIENFGFYLKCNESQLFSEILDHKILKKKFCESFAKGEKFGKDFEYLIKPISLASKLKQNNENVKIKDANDPNNNNNNSIDNNNNNNNELEGFSKINIYINLDKFDIDFQKKQFDNIIRIMNHTSNYQKFQFFHYESRKNSFFKPKAPVKTKPKLWWKYAITCVLKKMKYLAGNEKEYERNEFIMKNYQEEFQKLHKKFLQEQISLSNEEYKRFLSIIENVEENLLYQWSIKGIKENFTLQKKEENKKNKTSLVGKIFGKKINEENLLSNEEIAKIEEIIESSTKQLKNELILTSKEVKLKVEFLLNEGSFVFSRNKNDTKESFSFKYKTLSFHLKKGENFTELEAHLKDFNVDMITVYNKNKTKTSQITFYDKDIIRNHDGPVDKNANLIDIASSAKQDYIWKMNFLIFGPGEKINSKLNLHINNVNFIYDQSFLERVIAFFIIETIINQDIVDIAWDKWSEIKEKTSETLKNAFERKNILEINIEPRKMVIPLNKYDSKRSKILVVDFGNIKMKNTDSIEYYDERYKLEFINTNIKHYNSFNKIYEEYPSLYELVNNLNMNLVFGMLNKTCPNTIKESKPAFTVDLGIENINLKLSESLYYTMHFIIDVMKPTKNMDHWSIVEQSKKEIKTNCKVLGKILKKNNFNLTQEYFGVLSGGYLYFYKHLDDDQFESYFYIKDAIISEKISLSCSDEISENNLNNHFNSQAENSNVDEYCIGLKNKYGHLEIILPNENKYKQWLKGIRERIMEMKSFEEVKIKKPDLSSFDLIADETKSAASCGTSSDLSLDDSISNFSAAPVLKTDLTKNQNQNKQNPNLTNSKKENEKEKSAASSTLQESIASIDPKKIVSFALRITIQNVNLALTDENDENKIIFKCKFSVFTFEFLMRELDLTLRIELESIQIFNEKCCTDPSFHEMLTTINKLGSKTKIFSLVLLMADDGSPFKNRNAGMDLDLKIGCIYAVWQPQAVKRLLFFFAHNEILRNKIKEEITTPVFEEKNISLAAAANNNYNTENSFCLTSSEANNNKKEANANFYNSNFSKSGNSDFEKNQSTKQQKAEKKFSEDKPAIDPEDEFKLPNCSESKDLYLFLKLSLQEVKIFWVQPKLNHYFMEVSLDLTLINFEMTNDHMKIYGELGNTRLLDLTNYPYTIKTQSEYLALKNKNYKFTEILGFSDSSSLAFEYSSYSLICPLQKQNYTSKAHVSFNSVKLNFIQEHFFRVFNYLFADFLGALAAPQNIKDYKSTLSKLPKLNEEEMEFMDLLVTFNNPQLLLQPRSRFEESFLADLGTVTIKSSYKKEKNKSKIFFEKEKWITTYSFDLKDFYIITNDGFKLIEKTNATIDMNFINLTNEEKLSNDPDFIDKCFDFDIKLDDVNLNLRQKDFTNLMKCSDLNFVYVDGLGEFYAAEEPEGQKKLMQKSSSNVSSDLISLEDESFVYKCNKYNYMLVNLHIPNISLSLHENANLRKSGNAEIIHDFNRMVEKDNRVFASLCIKNKKLNFAQKITGRKDICLKASMFEIFHHLPDNTKELMLTQYNQNDVKLKDQDLFEITFVIECDRDKNIVIKINNLKTILRLDTLQLMRFFFTEGFPFYDESDNDLPNQFDPDTDKFPGMRVLIEIRKPIISLLSETISNHAQDLITLSTDFVLVYNRQKIQNVKRELKKAYTMLKKDIAKIDKSSKEKKLFENEVYDDKIETISINLWLYDICPFICSLEEFHEKDISIPKRKIMNLFDFHYESKTIMQYLDPDNYVITYDSLIDIKNIVLKISYRDLVLFLKCIEYNNSLLNEEYEKRIESLKNIKYQLSLLKQTAIDNAQNPQNDSRYSVLANKQSIKDEVYVKAAQVEFANKGNLGKSEKQLEKAEEISVNKDKIIDNGMSIMKINLEEIQIVLIDDHANTLYPFLSIIIQKFTMCQDCRTLRHSAILINFLLKLITYNYFAAIWEPFIEKSTLTIDYEKTTENNIVNKKLNINISEYKQSIMNINISDLTICFLYSTLNSWIEKYMKLKNNYQEEIKKLINDKNRVISNHKILNYTGRNLIIYRLDKRLKEKIKLKSLVPNEEYDLEYLIDENEAEDFIDRNKNTSNNKQTDYNFRKENLIAFEFEDLSSKEIIDNIIKIDKIQTKYYPVNFENIIKKYKTSREITKEYEQIISQVEYVNMKKLVKIYSPLCFKNKTQKNLTLVFQRRDLPNLKVNLGFKQNCGIPFEYLDGKVQFLNSESALSENAKRNEMIFDLKNFFDKDFSKIEFNLSGTFITLSSNDIENSILKTVNISTAFSIRNCLAFDLALDIPVEKNLKSFLIPKSETINLDFFSEKDNILANVSLLNFKNKREANSSNSSNPQSNKSNLIVLFNASEFYDQLEKVYAKRTNYTQFTLRSEFILYDEKNNPIKLFIQIEDNFYSKNLIIYANAVIINHTMLDLKLYYLQGKKHVEIPGQNNLLNSAQNQDEEKNIFLISDEKVFVVEVLNSDKKSINCFSEPIRLNAIGLSSAIECKNGKELKYEFINDTHLSLVAKDLQIYTNIIRILPRFVIVNELKVPISICLNNENYSNKEFPEVIKSKEKRPFHFFGIGIKSKTCFRPMEEDSDKKYQSGSKWMWSNPIELEKANYMSLQIPGINPLENKYVNLEKKIIESCTYIILSETNYRNCQFFVENNCKNKSFKVFQDAYEYSAEFLNAESKRIFSWANYNDKQHFCFECYDTANVDNIKSLISKYKMDELAHNKELNFEKLIVERNTYEVKEDGVSVVNRKKYSGKENNFVIIDNKSLSNSSKLVRSYSYSNNAANDNSSGSSFNNLIAGENDCNKFNYPFEDRIFVSKDLNVLITISTDGFRKIVRFSDEILNPQSGLSIEKDISTKNNESIGIRFSDKNKIQINQKPEKNSEADAELNNNNNKIIELKQFNFKISQLGISIISDNRFIKETRRRYNRFEILYIYFKEIEFLRSTENNHSINPPIKSTMQLKISHAEFDNQYSNFTKYPIILKRNMELIPVDKDNNPIMLPFFNLIVESVKNKDDFQNNKISDSESIVLFRYLMQSFDFSVDSEVMEAILNFISSITIELNTSLTNINPIFEALKQNEEQGITIKSDFYDFKQYYDNLKISSSEKKYFIENLITSSIEMKLSFNTNSKSKFFQNYITSNPFLSSILSTVSNIDKADINLNTYQMQNIYGSIYDILNLILVQYNQEILSKIFRIFGAADFLGNPNNLVKNLGTGFKDFFQKPIEGVMKGPLDGFKGAIDGSVSLVKHAVDGTFSATSKIAGGLSKGILYISQDEKYMNDIEKRKITEKPTNFIEGFGYGISSMASGVCSGVKDVFVKPVEGAKKENIAGFGKGILKGFGGLVSKPISGFLELVSKTSEGIKNTVVANDSELMPERKPRAFYGKHKYIKTFSQFDAYVIDILKNKVEQLKNVRIDYNGADLYKNHKNDSILIVFSTQMMYLIDLTRKEIKAVLNFQDIQDVILDPRDGKGNHYDKIRILFKRQLNGRDSATIYFSSENSNADLICKKMKKIIDDFNEK